MPFVNELLHEEEKCFESLTPESQKTHLTTHKGGQRANYTTMTHLPKTDLY